MSASFVTKLFDTVVEGSSYFAGGTTTTQPSYSVQESGDHRVQASLNLTLTLPDGANATWSLQVFKNNDASPLFESEQIFTNVVPVTSYRVFYRFHASNPGSACSAPVKAGWSTKDPSVGDYLTTGDTIYTSFDLSTPVTDTGYAAQEYLGNPIDTRPITNGVLGSTAGVPQC
jgi:hypothetical protein